MTALIAAAIAGLSLTAIPSIVSARWRATTRHHALATSPAPAPDVDQPEPELDPDPEYYRALHGEVAR